MTIFLFMIALAVANLWRQVQSGTPNMEIVRINIAIIVLCIIGIMFDVYFRIRV